MIAKYDHNKNKKLFCKIQIKKKKKKYLKNKYL